MRNLCDTRIKTCRITKEYKRAKYVNIHTTLLYGVFIILSMSVFPKLIHTFKEFNKNTIEILGQFNKCIKHFIWEASGWLSRLGA